MVRKGSRVRIPEEAQGQRVSPLLAVRYQPGHSTNGADFLQDRRSFKKLCSAVGVPKGTPTNGGVAQSVRALDS